MRADSNKKQRTCVRGTHHNCLGLIFLLAFSVAAACGQAVTPEAVASDPLALVRRAVANELKTGNGKHPNRYKLHKIDDGHSTTTEIVETKDGEVRRLLATSDQPLSADANQKEIDRLHNLLTHPEIQERKHKREQADDQRDDEMTRLLPNAFLYHFEGMANGPSGPAFRLSLKPNPNFHPPDRQAEVYAGMAGELWIDQQRERMVKLDVHLIDDVNFGWGILGKLYKGGSILVQQEDVGNDHWEQNHFKLDLHGKALIFKPLEFEITEDETDFVPVSPDWSYQDAIRLLLTLAPSNAGSGQPNQH
jgi:hypothetical protein